MIYQGFIFLIVFGCGFTLGNLLASFPKEEPKPDAPWLVAALDGNLKLASMLLHKELE